MNVGCVPKKVMFAAANMYESVRSNTEGYGISVSDVSFDWATLKANRDAYVLRLNGIYERNLGKAGVDVYEGSAAFGDDPHTVVVEKSDGSGSVAITGKHVLIATGGKPKCDSSVPGCSTHTINSDGFFELETLPAKIGIIGAGYIAVEMAGILASLGSEVHLFVRKHAPLRTLDPELIEVLVDSLAHQGIVLHTHSPIAEVGLDDAGAEGSTKFIRTAAEEPEVFTGFEVVLEAIGRIPNTDGLGLDRVGIELDSSGRIVVDEFQNTTTEGVYAVGDVCSKRVDLTPVAIAAGRKLAARLFLGQEDAKMDYADVATVIFSHPPIGSVGVTEEQAKMVYGEDSVKTYLSRFTNMFYAMGTHKPKTAMKLVVQGDDEKVVGIHVMGLAADEIIQGFSVALKMGATKADLDRTTAIHPTAGEELVTMR